MHFWGKGKLILWQEFASICFCFIYYYRNFEKVGRNYFVLKNHIFQSEMLLWCLGILRITTNPEDGYVCMQVLNKMAERF